MNNTDTNKSRTALRIFGIAAAAVCLILSQVLSIDGLSPQAMSTLGVLTAALFLLIFESFNVCVSCMLACGMLFAFGCTDNITAAFSGFSNHILYFTTASFGISFAFQKSSLSKRLLGFIIKGKKVTVRRIIFTFMLCAAILSSIMSNVAAVVIFIPYAEAFLEYYSDVEKKAKTRRSMMICLTVSALIGGMITPAGSSMNLICLDMLERYAKETVRFIDWMIVGFPLAMIILMAAYFVITRVYPPEEPDQTEMSSYLTDIAKRSPFTPKDVYTVIVISGVVATWIISSWFPVLNITVTSIAGLALLFIPKFSVMTWEEFSLSISWPTFFVAGSLISVAAAVTSSGLSDWFTGLIFPKNADFPEIAAVALVASMTFVLMAFLPSAPAVTSILCPLIIGFAQNSGFDPVMLAMASGLCVSNIYLFPLDAPLVVAYDKKAFRMFELPKATVWIQLIVILAVTLWVPFIFRFVR